MTSLDTENDLLYLTPHITSNIDFKTILGEVIDSRFHQSSELFKQDLQLITDLRQDSLSATVCSTVDLEVITKLKIYYVLLNALSSHFPDDVIEFQWSGIAVKSLEIERINVLYQLASYYSILALNEIKAGEEGFKKAGIYFQYSAGCLHVVQQSLPQPSDQLHFFNLAQLKLLVMVMLAQSQDIYLQKAVADQLKFSVLLKLALRISDFYDDALKLLTQDAEIQSPSPNYLRLRSVYFTCVSFNLYSAHCNKKKKYGEEISYLNRSLGLLHEVSHIQDVQYSKLLQDIENLKMQIMNKIETLKHENEMLHLQPVPLFDSLKPLPRAELVKCLVPKDLELDANSSALFVGLISLESVEQIYEYQNRFEDFVSLEVVAPITNLNQQIDELLENSNAEAEIEKITSSSTLPYTVIQSRDKILQLGNLEKIASVMSTLQELKLKCRFKLDTVWKLLKDQTVEEEALAKYYGYARWGMGVIEDDKKGAILINSFKIYENYMRQSEEGDKVIYTQVKELKPFLEIYEDKRQLEAYIPGADILTLNPALQSISKNIREMSGMLRSLKGERAEFLKNVKKKSSGVKILDRFKYSINGKTAKIKMASDQRETLLGDILKDEIMKFNNEVLYAERTKISQDELIAKFSSSNLEFINIKDRLRISDKRKESLQVLNSTYQGFLEVIGNLSQGQGFYQNLLDNIDVKMIQLDGFLSKRNVLKKSLQESLELSYR